MKALSLRVGSLEENLILFFSSVCFVVQVASEPDICSCT